MSLFAKWQGKLWLPPFSPRKSWVDGNLIQQTVFRGAWCQARVSDSQLAGHDVVTTDLAGPYREVLRRRKGARRVTTSLPVLLLDLGDEIGEDARLSWDTFGELESYVASPGELLASWQHKFQFREGDDAQDVPGLRKPQIGALHAISAHFAVGEIFEPATVVLPTGTGKTETMLATQVYRQLKKALVLVPSDVLREQIFQKFVSLGVLPEMKAIPDELPGPYVARLESGLRSLADAKLLVDNCNVIVTLPNTLRASDPAAQDYILEQCTDLIVDEAHHITAATWAAIRERFKEKRIIQFTATPFRRDEKRIDGKIIFNFKLGDAQKADYYRPIHLKTVEEFGDQEARDRAIAMAAIAALRKDREELGLDHLLMARTSSKERAQQVWALYQELSPDLHPVLVHSGPGMGQNNRDALAGILDREASGARIVVCVDMLGEGFDLPNLKVAALHDVHKSLAITLQFIGRFTRRGLRGVIGDATAVANIADPEAESKLASLYAEGADWDKLIQRLSEERIEKEIRLQDVVLALRGSGDLDSQLSLWNLRPALSTQIYRTACADWFPLEYAKVLPKDSESWHAVGKDNDLLVVVVHRSERIGWGNYENLFNELYDLILVKWDKVEKALFIYASDYDGLRTERLAGLVTGDRAQLVNGTPVFNILNNVELPLVKQLGSSRIGAISFTSYFGPNVTDGLASIEKAESSLNNIACLGYEDGDRVLWGCTQKKGKVWQQKAGTIAEWLDWCTRTWTKVSSTGVLDTNITRDFLRPQKLDKPHSSFPIAAQWGEQAQMRFSDRQFAVFGSVEIPFFLVDLTIEGMTAEGDIDIKISSDTYVGVYRLKISKDLPGGYRHEHLSGAIVRFKKSSDPALPLEEYLTADPFIIRYADGTHSYNCYHIPVQLNAGMFPAERIEWWDWTAIPLNEESMNKARNTATIQYRAFEKVESEYDLIFNDDGSGEAADLVALKDVGDDVIKLCLVHCKSAYDGRISKDIRNFYVLCGQAQKSAAVKHAGIPRLYHDLKRRHETWAKDGYSRFLKGDMKLLSYFREKARRSKVEFEVIIVQPGASAADMTPDALTLLATTELYLVKTTQAKVRYIVSK